MPALGEIIGRSFWKIEWLAEDRCRDGKWRRWDLRRRQSVRLGGAREVETTQSASPWVGMRTAVRGVYDMAC